MAQISLRDYLKGIEEIIDGGQIDDALAHCRHVLQSLPKHVDTYRLMGKAYLEAKRHSEASDIFQRVLSSVPDDFVAHIGMSIIREDEGNQDAAIWHMERAFEAQPSNRAVQDELRRLYGKREGYELPKVRLTRGALARMYAHGDLYTQAIGELRGALGEDAQRPDLQVLLAEMYVKTNRQTEAIDVCSKILETLPYCLYANRAMVDILRSSQREVEAQPYLERVDELDPYAVQVDTNTDVDSVAPNSVMIEQLQMEAKTAQPLPRAWTGSLHLPAEQGFEKEELPDWLSEDSLPQPPPEIAKEEDASEEPEDSVLGSLYGLDPMPLGEEAKEPEPSFKKSNSSALVDDQIPDWLRELRPATSTLSVPDAKPAFASDLQQEPAEEVDEREISAPEKKPTEPLPTFAEEEPAEVQPEIATPAMSAEDEENLGWLESLAAKQGAAEEELLTEPEEREQAQPEWATPAKPKSEALAWLDELSDGPATPSPTAPVEEPDLESEAEETEEVAPARNQAFSLDPEDPPGADGLQSASPNWLSDLSAEVKANDPELIAPKPLEEAPDWLDELRPQSAESQFESAEEPAEEESEWQVAASDLKTLDWLEETEKAGNDLEEPSETVKPQPAAELSTLDWLEESEKPEEKIERAEQAEQNVWVPEVQAEPAGTNNQPIPTPAVSPRTSARLQTAMLAPGKLEEARQALNYGKLSDAADHYGYLLRRRVMLDEVIADISAALRRFPQDVSLWQTLGDAYMRNNQLKEALDCYTKAEDLL